MVICLILIAAAVLFYLFVIPAQIRIVQGAQNEVFSPDTFPRLLTLVFMVCAVVLVINSGIHLAREPRTERQENREDSGREGGLYAIFIPYVVFAVALLYVMCFRHIGFVWATLVVPPLVLLVLKCWKWYYYAVMYVFAGLMYALFRLVLQVPLH